MNNTLKFEVSFADVKEIPANPLFSSCKIYVCYADENRNGSVIPKDVIEAAIPTIYNIPIVGRFSDDVDDFTDHGGKIEISGQGSNKEIKYVHTTKPYGVVPESASVDWESIDGKDYLVVEGGILWTGRYPEAQSIIDEGRPQSMEVDIIEGKLRKDKKFQVSEMNFSALCILGEDVEPAFEDAQITSYSLDTFKSEFSAMMQEIKSSVTEGGNDQVKKTLPLNFTLTSEQLEDELKLVLGKVTATDNWGWEYSRYGFVDYMPEEGIVIAIDWSQSYKYLVGFNFTVSGDLVTVDFDSVLRYKVNYVPMDVNGKPDGDEAVDNGFDGDDDDNMFALAVQEHFNAMMEFAKSKQDKVIDDPEKPENFEASTDETTEETVEDGTTEGETTETTETDETTETVETTENFEVKAGDAPTDEAQTSMTTPEVQQANADHVAGQAPDSIAFTELSKNFTELKESHDAIQAELSELREFKANATKAEREEAENALFARFSAHLSEEDIASIREKASEFTLEQLETQMFVLVGKKSATFSAKQPKADRTANRMPVFGGDEAPRGSDKSYASLIARFGNQK